MEILRYVSRSGKDLVGTWLSTLGDARARARISARIGRFEAGNFGDCRNVGNGVWELRIDWGPGYRVYYALVGTDVVLLLCGGDKRKQDADIRRAVECLIDYKKRTSES